MRAAFRRRVGLSQTELARRIDVSPETIRNWVWVCGPPALRRSRGNRQALPQCM